MGEETSQTHLMVSSLSTSLATLTATVSALKDHVAALPSKADLKSLFDNLEESYKKDFESLSQEIIKVQAKVQTIENAASESEGRLSTLERKVAEQDARFATQQTQMVNALLSIDDLENRSRRNNIRIRGLPEATMQDQLAPTVAGILNQYLGRDPAAELLLDRVHRVAGPISSTQERPRDVLCRVHYYHLKEEILRKAWARGPIDFDGANIKIFPDVSRRTLAMRRIVRPLLDKIRECGASYRWGHPFHLIIRKDSRSFPLKSPADLPEAFAFLATDPVAVPDWQDAENLQPLPPQRPRRATIPTRRENWRPGPRPPNLRSPRSSQED